MAESTNIVVTNAEITISETINGNDVSQTKTYQITTIGDGTLQETVSCSSDMIDKILKYLCAHSTGLTVLDSSYRESQQTSGILQAAVVTPLLASSGLTPSDLANIPSGIADTFTSVSTGSASGGTSTTSGTVYVGTITTSKVTALKPAPIVYVQPAVVTKDPEPYIDQSQVQTPQYIRPVTVVQASVVEVHPQTPTIRPQSPPPVVQSTLPTWWRAVEQDPFNKSNATMWESRDLGDIQKTVQQPIENTAQVINQNGVTVENVRVQRVTTGTTSTGSTRSTTTTGSTGSR